MATDRTTRQVFDLHLPEPQYLIVTQHLAAQRPAHQCGCMACGAQARAAPYPAGSQRRHNTARGLLALKAARQFTTADARAKLKRRWPAV
jgi:hypothetical protein